MHDGDELHSELGLYIMGDVFDGGCDGVTGCERGVYDNTEAFNLKVSLVQGFKGTSIVEVMIEGFGKLRGHDDRDES